MSQDKKLSKFEQLQANAAKMSNVNMAQSNLLTNEIEVELIKLNPYQPRKSFDEDKLRELSDSIVEHGLLQSITVALIDGEYILVAGERRLRATKLAKIEYIKAEIIENITLFELRQLALIENIQRENLLYIELAESYHALMHDESGEEILSIRELAKKLNKNKDHIQRALTLMNFDENCRKYIIDNKINVITKLVDISKKEKVLHLNLLKKLNNEDINYPTSENKNKTCPTPQSYPYELAEIKGVGIKQKKDKINIEINIKDFDITDSKNIEKYIRTIIEKIEN